MPFDIQEVRAGFHDSLGFTPGALCRISSLSLHLAALLLWLFHIDPMVSCFHHQRVCTRFYVHPHNDPASGFPPLGKTCLFGALLIPTLRLSCRLSTLSFCMADLMLYSPILTPARHPSILSLLRS